MSRLTEPDIAAALARLPEWRRDGIAISRTFAFKGFMRPMLLANAIAHLAEQANHHPELIINWGSLEVRLWTHVADGLTEHDFALARRIDEIAGAGRS